MDESIFFGIQKVAKYLNLDLETKEIAQLSATHGFNENQLQALSKVFSYLQDKKQESIVTTLLR